MTFKHSTPKGRLLVSAKIQGNEILHRIIASQQPDSPLLCKFG